MDTRLSPEEYVRRVLDAYRKTPGTMGTVRRTDRLLAAQLYERGISVSVIENAFVLAVMRRLVRRSSCPVSIQDRSRGQAVSSASWVIWTVSASTVIRRS